MTVAIIPARGGSKRIPRKNIKPFAGLPMIAHSIRAALAAQVFHQVVVSTDDPEIAAVAREHGASVPFVRPSHLADDHTPTAPVLEHAIKALAGQGQTFEYFCCLYATTPLVRPEDIRRGHKLLLESGAASAFAVTTFAFPIFRALKMDPQGRMAMLWPEYELTRSQDLPETWHDAGQFYWYRTEEFLAAGRGYLPDAIPVVLPRHLVQDIDTPEDWAMAEALFHALRTIQDQ